MDKNISPQEIHKLMSGLKIKSCQFTFLDNEMYEYIFINDNEFQLFRTGDIPTNYVKDE
jgi:hypothetical protein